jgi:hypothetical protein
MTAVIETENQTKTNPLHDYGFVVGKRMEIFALAKEKPTVDSIAVEHSNTA